MFFRRFGAGHFNFILNGHHPEFCQKSFYATTKLLVMCERISEALEIVYDVLYTFQHQ
jgi:hypothetical protein